MKKRSGYFIEDQYGCYFVTFTVVAWVDVFTRIECKDIIIESLKFCQENKGLKIHAYVIMSNHLHLVLSASQNSKGLSSIIHDFKLFTAKSLLKYLLKDGKESRRDWMKTVFKYHAKYNKRNATYQFWKQCNRPKALLHPRFSYRKINYIHNNPVKGGLVELPEHYVYSSAKDYAGGINGKLKIELIDFGVEEGYLFM